MKQNFLLDSVSEFFARDERKRPIWKSHEEFLFYLDADPNKANEVSAFIKPLITYVEDIEDLGYKKQIDDALYKEILKSGDKNILNVLDSLKNYKSEDGNEVIFKYVVLPAKNTFYTKIESRSIYICFDDENSYTTYDTFESERSENAGREYIFFYMYSKTKINAKHFLQYLYKQAHESLGVSI